MLFLFYCISTETNSNLPLVLLKSQVDKINILLDLFRVKS